MHRPLALRQQHEALLAKLDWWTHRIQQLRSFYFAVARESLDERTSAAMPQLTEIIEIDSADETLAAADLIHELLPLNWPVRCRQSQGKTPGCFVENLVKWLCSHEQPSNPPISVSDLELVFMLTGDPSFCFPFQLDGSTAWTLKRLDELFQTPTIVMLLRPVQLSLQHLVQLFPGAFSRLQPQPCVELGVYMKFRGLKACFNWTQVQLARERLTRFTCHRAVRVTADLARSWT